MADTRECSLVTGAFGYSGAAIARRLLDAGGKVRTLTAHPRPDHPLAARVEVAPLDFARPDELARSMAGARLLYNTYWVRFARGQSTHQRAVANTRILVRAAEQAGVRRIVHVSITQPSLDSPLSYFRGKAEIEQIIRESSLSYAILRPAVFFGGEDVLINNIAWLLRRFPIFAVPGDGRYRLQPIFVEDMAQLAVEAGRQSTSFVSDAVGPETFTYEELVRTVAAAIGRRARLLHLPPALVALAAKGLGVVLRDVLLTPDEVRGLMAGLLVSHDPPTGATRLTDWLRQSADTVGARYANELARHFRP
jgi:uncharacterized protein YbjT (DUF2867 family)